MKGISLTQVKKKVKKGKKGPKAHLFKTTSFILKFYRAKLSNFKWDYYQKTNARRNSFISAKKTNIQDYVKKTLLSLLKKFVKTYCSCLSFIVFFLMSQSDGSVFFLIIRGLFFITMFGFGVCLVHLFYQNISKIKIIYNFFGRVIKVEKKLNKTTQG